MAARRSTVSEGLYSGLVSSPFAAAEDMQDQMKAKLKLLVEAPAAVEDALASLLNHVDTKVQVSLVVPPLCHSQPVRFVNLSQADVLGLRPKLQYSTGLAACMQWPCFCTGGYSHHARTCVCARIPGSGVLYRDQCTIMTKCCSFWSPLLQKQDCHCA